MSQKVNYVADLSLYQGLPKGGLHLEDFEKFATRRLQVLRTVEDCLTHRRRDMPVWVKKSFNKAFEVWLFGHGAVPSIWEQGVAQCDVNAFDVHSHYALRLASCQDKNRRQWFIRHEKTLLSMRFTDLDPKERNQFLGRHGFDFKQISESEFQELKTKLSGVFTSRLEPAKVRGVNGDEYKRFYKVPFERVPGLVAQRQIYLEKGFAYVPKDEVNTLVEHHYEQQLTKAMIELEQLWRARIAMEEEDRLVPIIEGIHSKSNAADYRGKGMEAGVEDIEDLASLHFPLCMKNLFDRVLEEHHLKHNGRLQLQLFLKGIGLPYDQAYDFFKKAFAPKTGGDQFDKQYGYHIRHNYGLEGGRVNYSPYACSKIISYTPGAGEHAGCPFKTFSPAALHHTLTQKGIPEAAVEEILANVQNMHYRHACGLTWQGVVGQPLPAPIEHPNQYYLASTKARNPQQHLE